jgi:S-adenosylhomocysteine hydrolase
MSDKYPTLTKMGIVNPEDISRFSLQNANNIDVLRIVYKRKKGSLLPTSKKFRFGRSNRMVVTDSGSNKTEVVHEISPFLSKAIDELHKIINTKQSQSEQKEIILDEILRLEEETNTRINYLKTLIKNLD